MAQYVDQGAFNTLLNIIKQGGAGPFASSTSHSDDETEFRKFIGRDEQINIILNDVENVRDTGRSRAIRLQGEGGVGKSALFNYIWRGLRSQRGTPRMQEMLRNHCVEVGFITCTDEVLSFMGFWKLLCETLELDRQNFFELLLYRILVRLWNIFKVQGIAGDVQRKELESLLFESPDAFLRLHPLNFENLRIHFQTPKLPLSQAPTREKLKLLLRRAAWEMRKYPTEILIPSRTVKKVEFDARLGPKYLPWLVDLVPDEENNFGYYWEQLMTPGENNPLLKTDGDVFKFFEWAKDTFEWAEGKPVIFLVAVDEIMKPIEKLADLDAWKKLATLFVTMRNHLKHVLWVLIDTEERWQEYDKALKYNSDLNAQVEGFIANTIILNPLSREEMVEALRKRVLLQWEKENLPILRENPAAPFTTEVFEYIIDYYNLRLRKCIQACEAVWNAISNQESLSKFFDYYQSLLFIRTREKDIPEKDRFSIDTLHSFERQRLLNQFWSRTRFPTEGTRSTHIEEAITKSLQILRQDQSPSISEIKHNKQRGIARRPDVLAVYFSNEGPLKTLNVEYQVKIYIEGEMLQKTVPPGHLESSLELLESHEIDAFHLVSTVPLSDATKKKFDPFKDRVITTQPLNQVQLIALLCFQDFETLFRRPLTLIEAKNLLQVAFNKPWDVYIADLRLIPSWTSIGATPIPLQTIKERSRIEPDSGTETEPYKNKEQTTLIDVEPEHPILPVPPPAYVEEILKVVPQLERRENAFVYALQSAYGNKRFPNTITLSTLKKNHPSDVSTNDLTKIFVITNSRFHQIPAENKQKFIITLDGRAFLEKYKLNN